MEQPKPVIVDNRAFVFAARESRDTFNCSTPSHDTVEHTAHIDSMIEPYDPDKPYMHGTLLKTANTPTQQAMTLDQLMQNMYERPNDYVMHGGYDMNPADLCTILKQKHIVLQPSKRFCLVLLQYLTQQGLLQVVIKKADKS